MENDFNYKFVNYFLKNRQITILLLLIVVLGGLFSLSQLHTEGFPSISVPVVVVNTVLVGAGPETIADIVTTPLENALFDLDELKEYSSTSRNSVSTIVLTLESTDNINNVLQEIRTKIESVDLPENAIEPSIFVPEVGGAPFILAVSGNIAIDSLLQKAEALKEDIVSINGIKNIELISSLDTKLYIELESQYQTPDIQNQIKSATIAFPLGQTSINGSQISIAGTVSVDVVDDLKTLPITINNGTVVELQNIALVYTSLEFGDQVHRVGFRDENNNFGFQGAILYNVKVDDGQDIIALDGIFKQGLKDIEDQNPEIDFIIVFNQAQQSQAQIDEIKEGAFGSKWNINGPFAYLGYIFGGVWLLTIVMLLLVDWKSALISILTIPLAFLFTFITLQFFGIQLNTIVLFALVLVLGLVIDPAIVVLESIKRYTEIGFYGSEAALRAVVAVGRGVFVAVFTSFVVFIPFGIVGGTFGEIIKYIPLTVIPALVASYFIPMIFLTWLGTIFIKSSDNTVILDEDDPSTLWSIARAFIHINHYILQRLWLQIVVVILGLVLPIGIAAILFGAGKVQQVQFSQADDIEFITVSVPLPPNSSNSQRLEVARNIEKVILNEQKNIKTVAYLDLQGSNDGQSLSLFVELLELSDRDEKSGPIGDRINDQLVALYGERVLAGEAQDGPPQGLYPVSVEIFNNAPAVLSNASILIANELRTYKGVETVIYDDGRDVTKELTVVLNEVEIARHGLTPPAVYGQVASILGENKLFEIDNTDIVTRYPQKDKPNSIEELEDITIFGNKGHVRLRDIGSVVERVVPSAIGKINGERYVSVSARISDTREIIKIQRDIDDWITENIALLGLNERDLENRRSQNEFDESFQQLFAAIVFSIIITYLIFVVFFKSFVQPFIILFAVPLLFVGAFPALVIFARGQFGFLETLGVIVLIGVVENVAIFLIDFANQRVDKGMDKKEAIVLSTGIRFRPIVLTQLTSLAGLLPLAVFSPFWRGLAVVVIAGIISSGLLSLFTTPVLYNWFTRNKKHQSEFEPRIHYEYSPNFAHDE